LSGTYPDPVVSALQGNAVSNTAPANGNCLVWSAGGNQWEPAVCGKVTNLLQWYFAGTPPTGPRPMTLTVPEGITDGALTNSRIVANTPGTGSSTFNIERCTSACSSASPVFSAIYASDKALAADTRTVAGGTPTSTTVNAGDQFRVNLVSIGSGVSDVTVSLTYQYAVTN
jgi:hypothetical protein